MFRIQPFVKNIHQFSTSGEIFEIGRITSGWGGGGYKGEPRTLIFRVLLLD